MARATDAGASHARLEPLARIYLALAGVNRAIERAAGDGELLQTACDVIVDVGGFRMAWAGIVDRAANAIRPAASAGYDAGYVGSLGLHLDGPSSMGPTGLAVRENRTVVCDDVSSDERMAQWRSAALAHGYRASTALPLHRGGTVYGVLGVYSDHPGGFGPGEVQLLEELARTVSLGLDALESTAERRRAAEALAASEARFRTSLETLIDPFVLLRPVRDTAGRIVDFVYEYANEAACVANRTTREALVGRRLLEVLPEHGRAGLVDAYAHAMETGEPLVLDDLDYVDTWAGERMDRVFDVRARRVGKALAYTWREVTDRRLAERRRAEELERRVRERTAELETARERASELARFSAAALDATSDEVAGSLLAAVGRAMEARGGMLLLRVTDPSGVDPATFVTAASIGDADHASPTPPARLAMAPDVLERIEAGEPFVAAPGMRVFDASGDAGPDAGEAAAGDPARPASSDLAEPPMPPAGSPARECPDRLVVVPLRRGGASTGALVVRFEAERELARDELSFIASMANAAAHALERLRIARAEREARGMLDAVVAQMPIGVTVVDRDGSVLFRNEADLRTLVGVAGHTPAPTAPSADRAGPLVPGAAVAYRTDGERYGASDWPVLRSLRSGEAVADEEIALRRADGTSAIIMQTSAPVRDRAGQVLGAVVVTLDVTERRAAEQLRDAFLGVLSHELRTPVTTIYGGAKMLQTRGERLSPEVRDEILADVADESERLGRLVEDLLVLARAERGVDLTARGAALVQHRLRAVIAALAAEWPDRRFTAEIPEHVPPVTGDEGYLEQVLRNLLGNAAKYGRHEVLARIETLEREVRVTVLDDGPGIDPAELEHIFDLFARAHATNTLPGAGIGLFVARRLVEAMGGRLWAANRPEGGARFTFVLPQFAEG